MLSRFNQSLTSTLLRNVNTNTRLFSTEVAAGANKIEVMKSRINSELSPITLQIEDVSGGCGAFFKVLVVSDKFEGKAQLARHRLVQNILKTDIADMHGITLNTLTPKQYEDAQKE